MELCGQILHESRLNSPVDFDCSLKLPVLPVSNPAVMPETSNSDNRTTMISEQNNLKESDIFSKLALEIEAGNASLIRNEFEQVNANTSLAMNSLSGLNIHQLKEDKEEYVGSSEDASDSVEDSNNCGLGYVEYLNVSPGCSPENCEVKWPVCKKYPECPICTIDIEQLVTQRVSEKITRFPSEFCYQ